MTQELHTTSICNEPPMPFYLPRLSRTFSNYDDSDTKMVENWFYYGGIQPTDEVIQNGFPVLYYQIYCEDFRGQSFWACGYHFTETRKQRWNMMESITGLCPIVNDYCNMIQCARA